MQQVTPPRWRRRSEDRPREICAAALEVFAEKGFAAAKLDEIAKRAGVSKGTLYLYFKDKEQLFRSVVRDSIAPEVEAITSAVAALDMPFNKLIPAFFARVAENFGRVPVGAVAKMVIGESRNFPEIARVWHDEVATKVLGATAAMVAKAQERGEVRPGDPRLYAFILIGPMIIGALWTATLVPVGGQPLDFLKLASQHADTVLYGLLTGQDA